jgi:hypothetical protein
MSEHRWVEDEVQKNVLLALWQFVKKTMHFAKAGE